MRQSSLFNLIPTAGWRTCLAASLTVGCTLASAATYYVSPSGSDSADGSLVTPFQTVQKAAALAVAGDTVLIRQGIYRETVVPAASGTSSAPIIFKNYPGETATISGADLLTGWTQVGSDWRATDAVDLGAGQNQLFIDGKMATDARWPNAPSSVSRPVWSQFSSVNIMPYGNGSKVTITDPALTQATGFWVGAKLNFLSGPTAYIVQTGSVTTSAPGTLTFTTTKNLYTPALGNPYMLIGAMAQDAPNEWSLTAGVASLRAPFGDAATNHTLEVKKRKYGFDLSGRTFVNVQGIRFFGTAIKSDATTSGCDLSSLNAQYISHNMFLFDTWNDGGKGLEINGSNNTIRDSVLEYSSGNGVKLTGTNNVVSNCLIHDVNYAVGDEGAVYMNGSNHQVKNNTIYNVGRSGILHYYTAGAKILYNEIYYAALQSNDCGGTYCWCTDGVGTEIAYNVIHEMSSTGNYANAIFLDDNSSNFVVHHNVTYNVDYGFHQNPFGQNSQIYNNTWCGSKASVYFDNRGQLFSNVVLTNNVLNNDIWMPNVGITTQNNTFKTTDPKFAGAAQGNYQLLPGSPAIDSGLVLHPYTDNMLGTAPDQGAFESGTAPWKAGANLSTAPPPPPTGLATSAGLGRVSLSWLRRPEATSYNVYRSAQSGGPYTQVLSNVSDVSAYETTAAPNTTFYYVVTSVNTNGESSYGAEGNGFSYAAINLSGLVGTYYTGINLYDNRNGNIFNTPVLQRLDANVDFNWGYASPDPMLPADNFSVTWNGFLTAPVDGTYTFSIKTDNGVMLIINDQIVINQLTNVMGTFTGTINLKAGQKNRIRILYFEFDTTARCQMSWSYPGQALVTVPTSALTPPPGTGFEGNYYNDTAATFGAFSNFVGTRTDPELNLWANGGLYPGQNPTYYSAKWKGVLMAPVDGQYTLDLTADDGQRLLIDGQVVIDSMTPGGRQEKAVNVNWVAGSMHRVEIQMANGLSWGGATLMWAFPGQALQNIPVKYLYGPLDSGITGLNGTYYSDFAGSAPSFTYQQTTRVDDNVNFDWTGTTPAPKMPTDFYSVRWDGQIQTYVTATHIFTIKYDGGVRLWFNGKLVIDAMTQKTGATAQSLPMTIYTGQKYSIRVEYVKKTGNAKMQLLWQNDSPSGAMTVIPKTAFTKTSDLGG